MGRATAFGADASAFANFAEAGDCTSAAAIAGGVFFETAGLLRAGRVLPALAGRALFLAADFRATFFREGWAVALFDCRMGILYHTAAAATGRLHHSSPDIAVSGAYTDHLHPKEAMTTADPDFLTKSDLFANQARGVMDAVLSQGTFEHFGPGAIVFKQGEAGDRMYVIKSGVLEVIAQSADHAPETIAYLGVGEVVGELALLTGSPRSATIRCPENAELFRLDKAVFDDLMASLPGMARSMCEVIARRLEAMTLKSRRVESKQLSGNLKFFDLATVIQTLIGSHQTGSLVVSSPEHKRVSEIVFFKGNIVRAGFQQLKGDDAVFQLFQSKPEGEFAFTSREVEEQQRTDITLPGISLLMESVRMSDEFPMLQERLTDRKKVFKPKTTEFVWADPESLAPAKDVFNRLLSGASVEDLERESGRCSYWVYKVILTLQAADKLE